MTFASCFVISLTNLQHKISHKKRPLQNLISAATGMNLTTVDDPIQRKFLPSFLRGVAEENKLITSPNFVVTQALVALLADKGARLKPACDKADVEKRGM